MPKIDFHVMKVALLSLLSSSCSGSAGKKCRVGSFCRQMNVRGGVAAVGVWVFAGKLFQRPLSSP